MARIKFKVTDRQSFLYDVIIPMGVKLASRGDYRNLIVAKFSGQVLFAKDDIYDIDMTMDEWDFLLPSIVDYMVLVED